MKPIIVAVITSVFLSTGLNVLLNHFSLPQWPLFIAVSISILVMQFLVQVFFELFNVETRTVGSFGAIEFEESYFTFTSKQRIILYACALLTGSITTTVYIYLHN